MEVRLVKPNPPDIVYPAVVVTDDGNHLIVRAPWVEPEARDIGFAVFEPGDLFTEHYWRDRWYSVKEVRASGGALKGHYCDITRPAELSGGRLVVEDLDLDLWVSADGTDVRRLDEDEFTESGLSGRDPDAAAAAVAALDELDALARGAGLGTLLD